VIVLMRYEFAAVPVGAGAVVTHDVPDGAIVERLPVVNMRSDKAGEREVNPAC